MWSVACTHINHALQLRVPDELGDAHSHDIECQLYGVKCGAVGDVYVALAKASTDLEKGRSSCLRVIFRSIRRRVDNCLEVEGVGASESRPTGSKVAMYESLVLDERTALPTRKASPLSLTGSAAAIADSETAGSVWQMMMQ